MSTTDISTRLNPRTDERIRWLLSRLINFPHRGFIVAWDNQTVDDFVDRFPESARSLICYTIGPHSSPMLNRTAKLAEQAGFLLAGHVGNQDARRYNQRTWCRTWNVTSLGRQYISKSA